MLSKEEFYNKCADILSIEYEYIKSKSYIKRWGQRSPGNGRFPNFGLIRYFGPNTVHISNEKLNVIVSSEEAIEILKELCT